MKTSILFSILMLAVINLAMAQQGDRKIRIAKIEVYPDDVAAYRLLLAEHVRAAVSKEPGVLSLQAVYTKARPTEVTVFEVYANEDAYQSHLKTDHFLKYKSESQKMVKSLQLVDVNAIAIEIKPETSMSKH